jgi:hypothetical protein
MISWGTYQQDYFGGSVRFGKRWLGVKERQLPAVEAVISDPRSVSGLNLALPMSILRD